MQKLINWIKTIFTKNNEADRNQRHSPHHPDLLSIAKNITKCQAMFPLIIDGIMASHDEQGAEMLLDRLAEISEQRLEWIKTGCPNTIAPSESDIDNLIDDITNTE